MRKYTIENKLKCIELAEEIGYKKVSEITGIDRKSLREWTRKKEQLKLIDNKENTFRLPGGGAKPKTVEQEKQIVKFIENCNKIGIKVLYGIKITVKYEINSVIKNIKFLKSIKYSKVV